MNKKRFGQNIYTGIDFLESTKRIKNQVDKTCERRWAAFDAPISRRCMAAVFSVFGCSDTSAYFGAFV
jgi:hypothetical protein